MMSKGPFCSRRSERILSLTNRMPSAVSSGFTRCILWNPSLRVLESPCRNVPYWRRTAPEWICRSSLASFRSRHTSLGVSMTRASVWQSLSRAMVRRSRRSSALRLVASTTVRRRFLSLAPTMKRSSAKASLVADWSLPSPDMT